MAINKFCLYIISLSYSRTSMSFPTSNGTCNKDIAVHLDGQNKLSKCETMQVFAASTSDVAMPTKLLLSVYTYSLKKLQIAKCYLNTRIQCVLHGLNCRVFVSGLQHITVI